MNDDMNFRLDEWYLPFPDGTFVINSPENLFGSPTAWDS
jgi:hypothetical protein